VTAPEVAMPFDPLSPPPLLTPELPGIGGTLKQEPEDFQVEEIPAYQPAGSGEFLYLWVEKRAMSAEYFTREIARRLGLAPGDVGMAGLKDRQAVTRQMVSVPARAEERLGQLDGEGLRVLSVGRHGNKLRPGHLRGNRFHILARGAGAEAVGRMEPLLNRLRGEGLPNFYGPQRFGRGGETAALGLALLRGERPPTPPGGRPPNLRNRFLRKLALSAAQSALFNQYLAERLRAGLLPRVLLGDVMAKRPFGGLFRAEDVTREQARFEARATVHTGPIFGRKTFPAAGEAAVREAAVLSDAGLTPASLAGFGKLLQGTRRPNLVHVEDLSAAAEPEGIRLTFTLPAGSYATVLLREIMKDPDAGPLDVDEGG
jgi:tRNA pseudouridine13 synthase